jgi:hypothetical protein
VGRVLEELLLKLSALWCSDLWFPPTATLLLWCKPSASFCQLNLVLCVAVLLGYLVLRDIKVKGGLDSYTVGSSSLRSVLLLRGLW